MPYIIKTTTPDPANARDYGQVGNASPGGPSLMGAVRGCWPPEVTRVAVATLAEAREAAHRAAGASGPWVKVRPFVWDAKGMRPEGGTIGPLPDGTVIEVRRVDWMDFERMVVPGTVAAAIPITTFDDDAYRDSLIVAFNAA